MRKWSSRKVGSKIRTHQEQGEVSARLAASQPPSRSKRLFQAGKVSTRSLASYGGGGGSRRKGISRGVGERRKEGRGELDEVECLPSLHPSSPYTLPDFAMHSSQADLFALFSLLSLPARPSSSCSMQAPPPGRPSFAPSSSTASIYPDLSRSYQQPPPPQQQQQLAPPSTPGVAPPSSQQQPVLAPVRPEDPVYGPLERASKLITEQLVKDQNLIGELGEGLQG